MKWETVRLGDVCTFKTGKTPSTKKIEYFNGSINWYTPGDIGDSKFLTQSVRTITDLAIGENQASLLPENTLLVTCIGEIGRVGILSKPASSNQQITGLTFDERVLPKYAYYWFISNRNVLKDRSNNAVVPILNNAALKEISFKYPPLHIQEQIADTLDKADALRRKDQELLNKYEELAQAIFYDMFGDPVKNEKGWETGNIEKYFTLINGDRSANYPTNEDFVERGIPFYGTNDMSGIYLSDKVSRFITPQKFNSLSRGKLINGDIVITLRGSLGNTCLFKSDVFETGFINAQMMILRSNQDIIGLFTKYLFQAKPYQELFKKITGGSAVPQITGRQVANLPFIYPPLKTQKLFSQSVIKCLDIQEKTKQNAELQLFETLLTKHFS
jgi:type I restriction enzyme S subunit